MTPETTSPTAGKPCRLTVTSSVRDVCLFSISWVDGKVSVHEVKSDIQPAVDRWLTRGINEYIGPRHDPMPRHTDADHPEFLPRLKDYLERQFPLFDYDLQR